MSKQPISQILVTGRKTLQVWLKHHYWDFGELLPTFSWIFQHYTLRSTFRANTSWNLGEDDYFAGYHMVQELQSIAYKDLWIGFLHGPATRAQSLRLPPAQALLQPALAGPGSPVPLSDLRFNGVSRPAYRHRCLSPPINPRVALLKLIEAKAQQREPLRRTNRKPSIK